MSDIRIIKQSILIYTDEKGIFDYYFNIIDKHGWNCSING
jgi:hypothetical protein